MAKVKALRDFTDKETKKERKTGDIFECSETRYEFLKSHNAVELVEEEVKEEVVEVETMDEIEIPFREKANKKKRK